MEIFFSVLTLFGGLAMFLYGMKLMGNSLKESSSGTFKKAMEMVTNNPIKAFLLGMLVTAIIQSSTATIVITAGLVVAGVLSVHQSLGIIIGANVGTTITGQIIRLLDVGKDGASWINIFKPDSLAPIALIIGIVLIMTNRPKNSKAVGNIAIGFGILFMGLITMTSAVEGSGVGDLFSSLGSNPVTGYITGAIVSFVLQSSSAAVGILQAIGSAPGSTLTFASIYAVIIGIFLGDCITTGIVCWIGGEKDSKRVGLINIIFNIGKSILAFLGVFIAFKLGWLDGLWTTKATSGLIANTNTVFNLVAAILLLPTVGLYEKLAYKVIREDKEEDEKKNKYKSKIEALNPAFFDTPALALNSCFELMQTTFNASRDNIDRALKLIDDFDEKLFKELQDEEVQIDRMTDEGSKYLVGLLPHLQDENHTAIVNQYYKVISEFESLGDYAVHIADIAQSLDKDDYKFSVKARAELQVLYDLIGEILDYTELAFSKRDKEACYKIETMAQVAVEMMSRIKSNHLKRMSKGECSSYLDANFSNLLMELGRATNACSNVAQATMLRIKPKIAGREHSYFESMREGENEKFNERYKEEYNRFFSKLDELDDTDYAKKSEISAFNE